MGGLQGKLIYEGELAEFLPLQKYCEVAHLGKQKVFGLGRGWKSKMTIGKEITGISE
jgi:hypothetical protein